MQFQYVQMMPIVVDTETLNHIYDLLNAQADGVSDSSYNQGMYNGMELILSMIEKRHPLFKNHNGDEVSDLDNEEKKRYRMPKYNTKQKTR